MTPEELKIARAFRHVRLPPGSDDKRFASFVVDRGFYHAFEPLSHTESVKLRRLAYRYRHQLPPDVARLARP